MSTCVRLILFLRLLTRVVDKKSLTRVIDNSRSQQYTKIVDKSCIPQSLTRAADIPLSCIQVRVFLFSRWLVIFLLPFGEPSVFRKMNNISPHLCVVWGSCFKFCIRLRLLLCRPPLTLTPLSLTPRTLPPCTLPPLTLTPLTLTPRTLTPRTLPPLTLTPLTLRPRTVTPLTLTSLTLTPLILRHLWWPGRGCAPQLLLRASNLSAAWRLCRCATSKELLCSRHLHRREDFVGDVLLLPSRLHQLSH